MTGVTVIGSSSVEPGSVLAGEIARRIPGVVVTGVRSSSVSSWVGSRPQVRRGDVAVVYLPGQQRAATAAEVTELTRILIAGGARSVMWVVPPVFRGGAREAVALGTANAIRDAGVPLARDGRFVLQPGHVASDGVHLTPEGSRAFAEWVFEPRLMSATNAGIFALALALSVGAWLIVR